MIVDEKCSTYCESEDSVFLLKIPYVNWLLNNERTVKRSFTEEILKLWPGVGSYIAIMCAL
jgi:hypothetical protein